MTALLDMFDEIECVFDRITRDQSQLSNLIKLPANKVQAIFDQVQGEFTLMDLKNILRRSEEILKDKQTGKIFLPASKSVLLPRLETITTPNFYEKKFELELSKRLKTREDLEVKTLYDHDRQRREIAKKKIENLLGNYRDVHKKAFADLIKSPPAIFWSLYRNDYRGTANELENVYLKLRRAKDSGILQEFVKAYRKEFKAHARLKKRGDTVRKTFQRYGLTASAIAETFNTAKESVSFILESDYQFVDKKTFEKLERLASTRRTRASLFATKIKYSKEHSETFIALYEFVREKAKRLVVNESLVTSELRLPATVFNSLRAGTFHTVTPNTLTVLKSYFEVYPNYLSAE